MVTAKRKSVKKRATSTTKSTATNPATPSTCQALLLSIKAGVLIALAIFLLTGVWGMREYIHTLQEPAEMSFTGTGEHFITNSTAKIRFSFSNVQQDISAARDTVAKQAQNAYTLLTQANIAKTDIQTTSYTIHPEYERPTPTQPLLTTRPANLIGYRVSHTTTVVIRDSEKIGPILAALTDLNPETVTGPQFSPDETHKRYAKDIATIKAIHDAKSRAYKIAHLSDLRLKKIKHINIYENSIRPYARLESASIAFDNTAQTKTVPIQEGEQKIQQTAVITYEVEERKKWKKWK